MQPKPFTFQEFGPAAPGHAFAPFVKEEVPVEKRTYSSQDLLLAEREGHERGYSEGLEAGKKVGQSEEAEINRTLAASLAAMEQKLNGFFKTYSAALEAAARDTSGLALSIARKVVGEALGENPYAKIESMVKSCMDLLFAKSDIVLTLNPDALAPVQLKLDALGERHGFKGRIHYKTDPALTLHDCTLVWQDGGARLDTPGTWKQIEEILTHHGLQQHTPVIASETAPVPAESNNPQTPAGA